MKIIENKNVKVYYYESKKDLITNEKEFRKLKINLEHYQEIFPRICPRTVNGKTIYFVLLYNTGDMKKDLEKLNKCLETFKLPEFKEL
jgi:hypothetical protein